MIKIQIDERELRDLIDRKLEEKLKQVEADLLFWDFKELMRQTCMGENSIREKFFYDPRFPKHKVGGKWYFPAKETREFLLGWLGEQPRN